MRSILISIFTLSVLLLIITYGCKKVDESTGIARINFNPLIDYGTLNDIEVISIKQ
jgi:hypothetical protein